MHETSIHIITDAQNEKSYETKWERSNIQFTMGKIKYSRNAES